MNLNRDVETLRQVAGRAERLCVKRVDRMGRQGWRDQFVVREFLCEGLGALERVGWSLRIGDGKFDDRLPRKRAQARRLGDPADLLLEVIHVGKRRGAGL